MSQINQSAAHNTSDMTQGIGGRGMFAILCRPFSVPTSGVVRAPCPSVSIRVAGAVSLAAPSMGVDFDSECAVCLILTKCDFELHQGTLVHTTQASGGLLPGSAGTPLASWVLSLPSREDSNRRIQQMLTRLDCLPSGFEAPATLKQGSALCAS